MSRTIFPNSISYDAPCGRDIYSTPQKDMLDINVLNSHKEHKESSQIRRISKKLMKSYPIFILYSIATIMVGTVFTYSLQGIYVKYIKKTLKNFIKKRILRMN